MAIKKPLNISEEAAVQMPMKTVASLIIIVALGTMGYFQIVERLNIADTRLQLMEKDLEENTEFRIKWPRGQLGALPLPIVTGKRFHWHLHSCFFRDI